MPEKSPEQVRIQELEDALKDAERRTAEMKGERDEANALVERMIENVQDCNALIASWIEAFDMELNDDGKWSFEGNLAERYTTLLHDHRALIKEWNRFVPDYNAAVRPRPAGRPLDASDAQCAEVRKLRKRKLSLRSIAEATNLSLRTVRTIVDRANGTDRATIKRLEKVDPMNAAFIAAKARKRTRDALPDRISKVLADADVLKKTAKGLV